MEEIFHFFFIFHDGIKEEFITSAKGGGGSGSNASDGEWWVKLHAFAPCRGARFLTGCRLSLVSSLEFGDLELCTPVHTTDSKKHCHPILCMRPSWAPLLLSPHDENVPRKKSSPSLRARQRFPALHRNSAFREPLPPFAASWLLLLCPRWGPLSAEMLSLPEMLFPKTATTPSQHPATHISAPNPRSRPGPL